MHDSSDTRIRNDRQKELEHWFQSALGRALLANQRPVIEHSVRRVFGVHQAELGVSHRIPVGNGTNLGHKFFVLPEWEPDLPENIVISTGDELALDRDVVDLMILHHTLDFTADPHQLLREASRALKSTGYMLIVGFNPLSWWGVRRWMSRTRQAPWNTRFLPGRRVEDWLSLLDFKVGELRYHFFTPPINSQRIINRFLWLDNVLNQKVPLGAYYTLLAQKQVGSRISISPRWKNKAKVVGLPLANRVKHTRSPD
ncbi:MAG: methyltransferase domain-containing protein [Oleiphilaceae bacterium]|nr:methyltransferase domain-containing protein [Oleiphilaceae bacterium]